VDKVTPADDVNPVQLPEPGGVLEGLLDAGEDLLSVRLDGGALRLGRTGAEV
jgi:hypothetical protein